MRGNFGLFRSFSPKLPRTLDYIVMQMRKTYHEKGYSGGPEFKSSSLPLDGFVTGGLKFNSSAHCK